MIRKFAPQEDLDQATLLYVTSFPKEERRETTLWQKMVCKLPHMTTYTILYKESFAGFFTFWDFHNFVYGEHFAIDPLLRRKNIGGQALEGIIKVLNKPLIIEVEPKGSNPMANRRIDFYIRHGLKLSNRPYLQPPYQEHGKSIPLQLMATNSVFLEDSQRSISEMFYVSKRIEIAYAHQLKLDYESKCTHLHGHNAVVTVYCKAKELDHNGMVVDFKKVKDIVQGKLDHRFANDVVNFNTTAENLAKWICDQVPHCYKVSFQESEGNIAIYIKEEDDTL